jgi:hypothetical protein
MHHNDHSGTTVAQHKGNIHHPTDGKKPVPGMPDPDEGHAVDQANREAKEKGLPV